MIAPPSTAKTSKTLAKLFLYYSSLNKVTLMCKLSGWYVLLNLKKYKLLTYDLLLFVSYVHDCMITCEMTCVGYWYFCIVLLTLWLLSLNKWNQQNQMFIAEVFRTTMKNFESFTGHWRLLFTWRVMLELHLSLRTGSLRSWNDLHISFRETGAVHMIFRQNFVVPGHWFSPKKFVILWVRVLTVREKGFGCCCYCCWQPHVLLICNSWFFKLNITHQSETLFRLL